MNNITIELCAEDRQRLDLLADRLARVADLLEPVKVPADAFTAPQPAPEPVTLDTGHPVDEISPHGAPGPVVEPEPAPAPKWTKEDLTKKVQALAAPHTGKREKVRDIVKSYAANVGAIPEDKYDEVMDKLTALEQEV